jgi:hypothetical protein
VRAGLARAGVEVTSIDLTFQTSTTAATFRSSQSQSNASEARQKLKEEVMEIFRVSTAPSPLRQSLCGRLVIL